MGNVQIRQKVITAKSKEFLTQLEEIEIYNQQSISLYGHSNDTNHVDFENSAENINAAFLEGGNTYDVKERAAIVSRTYVGDLKLYK